ncbi:MAG TPA: VOC family protein, partial [Kofleriaceae bacterium]|nr:VOC family protein [Kofleriaceae bacterium]
LRMDGRAERIRLHQGPADDLAAIGWQVGSEAALEALAARLTAAGHAAIEATAAEAAEHRVVRMFTVRDPAGTRVDLGFGPALAETPFASPLVPGGFVADELGLGHLVISAPDPEATGRFYQDLLGFRLSDRIACTFYGHPVDITFLHTNPRHHSLAFGGAQDKRLHHFLLEVRSLDEVGMAFDRALRHKVRIAQTLGRHPNDRMISFYAHTPSGFQFEYGCGGRLIDDASWDPVVHDRISEWGHHPPQVLRR